MIFLRSLKLGGENLLSIKCFLWNNSKSHPLSTRSSVKKPLAAPLISFPASVMVAILWVFAHTTQSLAGTSGPLYVHSLSEAVFPSTGSEIKNLPSRKAALLEAQRAVRTSDLSNPAWHFTALTVEGLPLFWRQRVVLWHPDTCAWGSSDLASNQVMNQSGQRALFLRRENIAQGAYVDGVTVSKPGIEKDRRGYCFLGELALFPGGSGDVDHIGLLWGSETDRIISQSLWPKRAVMTHFLPTSIWKQLYFFLV